MENLIGLKGGQDATYFEVLAVKEALLEKYPSVVNGKEQSFFDAPSTDHYMRHKKTVAIPGMVCTVAGNACSSEYIVGNALGEGWNALAVGPNTVEAWKDSDYQAELSKILKEEEK